MSSVDHSKNVLIHSSISAGGSVSIGDNISNVTVAKPLFSEINLEAYDEGNGYISPRFTGRLVGEIMGMKAGKMAVLTGFYGFDKAGFAKHLAYQLAQEYENAGKKLLAKECMLTSDYYGISSAIKESTEDCIFVFNNLTPKDVNHNLEALQIVARKHSQLIIILISTNLPLTSWKNPHADYWFSIETDGLYHGNKQIAKDIYEKAKLLRYLTKSCDQRGLSAFKLKLKEELDLLIPNDVNTPEQIGLFLDLFSKSPTEDERAIRELIAKTKKKDTLLSQWFDSLEEDKQLVALGMTLLDGVYDEQFFAIMEQLVKEAWEPFHHSVAALDYNDLNTLMHFFNFTSGDTPTLEAKFPNQRFQTLQVIWDRYRRRITATLPVLVRLAAQSVSNNAGSWELFGDGDRRIRLRETLAEVFSDIGRLSPQTVEPWLLQLAAHGNVGVQLVAARALAQWRESYDDSGSDKTVNKEQALFDFLFRWNRESRTPNNRILQLRQSLFKEEGSQNSPTSYVRATILLTLGYASVYDSTNTLRSEIPDLIKEFARDRNALVISRLRDTLRLLIRNHPWQIGDRLFDMGSGGNTIFNEWTPTEHYAGAIAAGLADAYVDYPADVEGLLDSWLDYCKVERPKHPNLERKLTYREKILATVVFTYGLLDLSSPVSLTLDKAAADIETLRQVEHNPEIRRILLEAILIFYERYFDDMEARHGKKIPKMAEEERKRAAENYKKRYLFERSEAAGGDYEVEIEGARIESWRNREDRPLTEIESLLIKWVGSENENVRRIALQSFIEFSKIEAWEEQQVRQYLEGLQKEQDAKSSFILPRYDDSVRKSLWTSMIGLIIGSNRIKEELMSMAEKDENMGAEQVKILKEKLIAMGVKI